MQRISFASLISHFHDLRFLTVYPVSDLPSLYRKAKRGVPDVKIGGESAPGSSSDFALTRRVIA